VVSVPPPRPCQTRSTPCITRCPGRGGGCGRP